MNHKEHNRYDEEDSLADQASTKAIVIISVYGHRNRLLLQTRDNIPPITLSDGRDVIPFLKAEGHYDELGKKGVQLYYEPIDRAPDLVATFFHHKVEAKDGSSISDDALLEIKKVLDYMGKHFLENAQVGYRRLMAQRNFPCYGD